MLSAWNCNVYIILDCFIEINYVNIKGPDEGRLNEGITVLKNMDLWHFSVFLDREDHSIT